MHFVNKIFADGIRCCFRRTDEIDWWKCAIEIITISIAYDKIISASRGTWTRRIPFDRLETAQRRWQPNAARGHVSVLFYINFDLITPNVDARTIATSHTIRSVKKFHRTVCHLYEFNKFTYYIDACVCDHTSSNDVTSKVTYFCFDLQYNRSADQNNRHATPNTWAKNANSLSGERQQQQRDTDEPCATW